MKHFWRRFLFIIGTILLIGGAIDPLEGSLIIALGSILITISLFLSRDRYRRVFLIATILILFGFLSMWYLSYLGGFDIKTQWYWLVPIAPYPIGWVMSMVLLIMMMFRKK